MTTHTFVRAHPWVPWILAAACLAFAAVFALLGANVVQGSMQEADRAVREWVVTHRPGWSVALAGVISMLGATQWLAVIAGVTVWLLLRRGLAWVVLLALCALSTSHLVDLLKEYFDVLRPPFGAETRRSLSFPSGHAAGSVAVMLFLSYVVSRHRHAWEVAAVTIGIGVAVLVGLARVFMDVHWLSDVVGGWIVGTAVAVGYCAIWEWTQRYQRDEPVSVTPPPGSGSTRS